MERYQVWVSVKVSLNGICEGDCCDSGYDKISEAEFMLTTVKDLRVARDTCSHMLDYPAIESAWIVRTRDGEVVQPHERF